MLIVHPLSTCDVCLDAYNWTTPGHSPHAIACGHVFCLQCLQTLSPSICPLCRKAFSQERIKKLHIDRLTSNEDQQLIGGAEEGELLQRVALVFGENTSEEHARGVIEEAKTWLSARAENASAYRALRSAVDGLHRYRTLQQESREDKNTIEDLLQEHRRKLLMKEQDLQTARAVEENLLDQIQNLEAEFKAKLTQVESELSSLKDHSTPRMSSARINHDNLSNPLPPPPDPSRYDKSLNPLPQPPQPVTPERLASFSRPPASVMSSSQNLQNLPSLPNPPSALYSNGQGSSEWTEPEHLSTVDPFTKNTDELRRDKALRPPLLVPGAPATQKVIPPRPAKENGWDRHGVAPSGMQRNASSSSVDTLPARSINTANTNTPLASGSADEFGYQYGFVPGHGYAWAQVPWPSTAGLSSSTRAADVGGRASSHNGSGVSVGSRPAHNETIPNSIPREVAPSISRHTSTRSERRTQNSTAQTSQSRISPAVRPGDQGSISSSASHSNTSTMSNTSLTNLTLLSPPQTSRPGGRDQQGADHRDIMSILGVSSGSQAAEPSPAPSWGTIHSSQIPSRNSTSSSASIGDLPLVGLPATVGEPSEEDGVLRDDSSEDTDEVEDEDFMTPRRHPLPYGRADSTTGRMQPAHPGSGLGLLLSDYRELPRQVISGPQELQIVSQSLMQFVTHGGRESRAHGRSSRDTPTAHISHADVPDTILGARTGVPLYSSRPQSRRGEEDRPPVGPTLPSRTHSDTTGYHDRESMSDSEHIYSRYGTSNHRRHSSISGRAAVPMSSSHIVPARDVSVTSRVSDRSRHNVRFQSPVDGFPSRQSRNHAAASHAPPPSAIDSNGFVPALGQSSLLLNFHAGTTSSTAVNGRGEDAGIHAPAPRPVSSRHNNLFGMWHSRSGH